MLEHAEQPLPMMPTIDDLLNSHNMAREQNFIPDKAGHDSAARVRRLPETVGDGQANEWVVQMCEKTFDRNSAQSVLQNAAIRKGKPFDTHEIGRMFNALQKFIADYIDLHAGNTTAIVKRWESRTPGRNIPSEAKPIMKEQKPHVMDAAALIPQVLGPNSVSNRRANAEEALERIFVEFLVAVDLAPDSTYTLEEKAEAHRMVTRGRDSRGLLDAFARAFYR